MSQTDEEEYEYQELLDEYETPFFDFTELDDPSEEYVCWIDIMGTRSHLKRSLKDIGFFFGKLHSAILDDADFDGITVYPVMDGAYIVSEDQGPLIAFLDDIFTTLAVANIENDKKEKPIFPIRASIAYGPVIHGNRIPYDASWELGDDDNSWYTDALLLGMPMIQAAKGESKAPPFGIYIHESARAFSPRDSNPLYHIWWEWYQNDHEDLAAALYVILSDYFSRCEKNHHQIPHYTEDKIKTHKEQLNQYFLKEDDNPTE